MDIGRFTLHRRAFTALNQLSAGEQAKVRDRLAPLAGEPRDQWPAQTVKPLKSDPDLYLVRIDDSLRAIVRAPDGADPEVLDIVRHETLESFAKAKS